MLILSRKPSQIILIGANLFLTVGSTNSTGVQLFSYHDGKDDYKETRLQVGYDWQITNDVIVRVLETQYGVVKLGIDAPREISVDRLEVRQAKLARIQAAANRRVSPSVVCAALH